jgi:hypothetical protein
MDNNASFRKFLGTQARNGSDKGFMHQKKYQKIMEPIIEEQELPPPEQHDREDENLDMVDYGSSGEEDENQDEQEGAFIEGAILGLAAPSLEHERMAVVIPVDGSQPEVENMQEDMQEGLTQEEIPEEDASVVGRRGMTTQTS